MEQKNENEFLILKNYCNFLTELGLNTSFSQEDVSEIKRGKIEKNFKSIYEIDCYIKEWQIKNDLKLILRNNIMSSKFFLLLSEENNFINFDQFKKNQPDLLEKIFSSIEQNIDDFFIINIDLPKMKECHLNQINKILKLYFTVLKPKIFIDMCSDHLHKSLKIHEINLDFDYFKIPSVSHIIKNHNLKREAWSQLKLLKVKLNAL